jgi:glycosyltransferase involved in cell wall biosynthesis
MPEKVTEQPLVTVVTLMYNTGKYITDTLDSIKNQTYKNIQHIIIDDCSKDDSVDVTEKWIRENNWPCNFVKNTANKGICGNLNYAIKELAEGEYCAIIGDDIMMPTKIKDDVDFMRQHPDYMFCYSKMTSFDVASGIESFPNYVGCKNPFHEYIGAMNLSMPAPTLFYRKEVFEKVGYYDERYVCEDFDMVTKIVYRYPVGFRDVYTVRYIVHPGSMTVSKKLPVYKDVLRILKEKWSFLPKYSLYRDKRCLSAFCVFAKEHKKEAIKYLPHSLRFFYSKVFIQGFLVFLLRWPKAESTGRR